MNQQLSSYPNAMDSSKLGPAELKEILEFTLPEVWWKHMMLQRFIRSEKSLKQDVDFSPDLQEIESSSKVRFEPPALVKNTTLRQILIGS